MNNEDEKHPFDPEDHPFDPFYPKKAKWLFLGTFPPKKEKWANNEEFNFYYPNFNNDMWRILALVFNKEKDHFEDVTQKKSFDKEKIKVFLEEKGIAMYNIAKKVVRLKDNASDKDLRITEYIKIKEIIENNKDLEYIVATGTKAYEKLIEQIVEIDQNFKKKLPIIGLWEEFIFKNRTIKFYRMPSSSKAYPKPLEKKVEFYKDMFSNNDEKSPHQ
ncbi:MAG: uracil-DNA glycosylase family protein [Bacteroidales bacterium]|nr:uracil-DNA glycosylase family protein [Bacteroidales bacterium]